MEGFEGGKRGSGREGAFGKKWYRHRVFCDDVQPANQSLHFRALASYGQQPNMGLACSEIAESYKGFLHPKRGRFAAGVGQGAVWDAVRVLLAEIVWRCSQAAGAVVIIWGL